MRLGDRIALLASLAILGTAVWLLPEFRIEPDLAKMLPPDHPHTLLSAQLDRSAENRRSVFIILRGAVTDVQIADLAEALRTAPEIATVAATRTELLGKAWQAAADAPLWSLPEAQVTALQRQLQPQGRREALRETLDVLAEDPVAGRELAARDPLGLRWVLRRPPSPLPLRLKEDSAFVVFAAGDGAILRVVGVETAMNPEFADAILEAIEGRIRATGLGFDLFGGYVIARNDAARIRFDLISSVVSSVILVALYLLLFCMGSHTMTLLALLPVGLAAFCAMSIGGAAFGPLSPIAIAAAAVLLGLGVDFAIHYLVRYQKVRETSPRDDAIQQTHRSLAVPLGVGMLTTAVAFLSLARGEFGGLAGFGMLLALGLGLAYAGTLFLLPVLLRLTSAATKPARRSSIATALDRIAHGRRGRPIAYALIAAAAVAWTITATHGIELRADAETLRPADDPINATRIRLENELGMALLPCFLLIDASVDDRAAREALATLRRDGLVRVTAGLSNTPESRREIVAEFRRQTAHWLAGTRRDMEDLGFDSSAFLPVLRELQSKLDADPAPGSGMTVTLGEKTWRTVLCYPAPGALSPSGWEKFQAAVRDRLGDRAQLYGTPALQDELERMLRADLTKALGITIVLAFGLVFLALRSFRAGILALLPTFCGLGFTLAALSLSSVPITLGNFIALPFLLGIAVDDGVHLVAQLRNGGRAATTGVAVVRTSLTTMIAFGSLITAASPGLASLGWIVSLGVTCCLLTSLLVLPPLWSNSRT